MLAAAALTASSPPAVAEALFTTAAGGLAVIYPSGVAKLLVAMSKCGWARPDLLTQARLHPPFSCLSERVVALARSPPLGCA